MFDMEIYKELAALPEQQPDDFDYPTLRAKVEALAEEFYNLYNEVREKDHILELSNGQVDYLRRRLAIFEDGRDPAEEVTQRFTSTMKLIDELDDHLSRAAQFRKDVCLELILYLQDHGHQKAAGAIRKKENM